MSWRAGGGESMARCEALYEQLRNSRTGPDGAGRRDVAVLQSQGLAAWMQAWAELPAPSVPAVPTSTAGDPGAGAGSAEVVRVLAAMILSHIDANPRKED